MRVLVACEFTGTVRRAFRARGHDAWSCDILPAEDKSRFHFQCDAREILNRKWDILIAHPPCTYLANSGVLWLSDGRSLDPDRYLKMKSGGDLFAAFYHAKIPRICVENPIMHTYARRYLDRTWGIPVKSQMIQPWMFGHGEQKGTCLWLRELPRLKPTLVVRGREQRVHRLPPSKERAQERSRTYQGIADAMASQWDFPVFPRGGLLDEFN